MANTIVYNKYDYQVKVRERISKPTCWQDILLVKYSNARAITGSYMSTEPSVVGGTRGTAYNYQSFVLTADTLTINQYKNIPMFIDEADRHQQSYVDQMSIAAFQGDKISEKLESLMLANHGSWKDFGLTDLANTAQDDSSAITVSAANIDDILRAVKRKLRVHHLVDLSVKNGVFFVWRPEDFEFLEGFVQANGFQEADLALKNGIPVEKAFYYLGCYHYLSTQHTAGHVFCGIKKTAELGILRGTFGKVKFNEDPPVSVSTAAPASGLGIVSRVDYGFNHPAQLADAFIDLNVA
uniref:Capsid protein n=1 Tax=viral metagenome TaxID=1070528 RepID=A0A6H1ZG44_9ZZZZ